MSSNTPVVSNPPRLQGQVRLLLNHIESQGFQGGERLESERELAKILGISRPSLREAIQILQVQGRLRVKHGIGIFVLDQADGEKLRESLRAAQHRIEELFQMREILEAPAVEWAAERRSEEQLAEMRLAAKALNEVIARKPVDFENLMRLDMEFHLTIVRSAQNQFLNQTLGTLQEIMYHSMDNTLKLPGRVDSSEHEHGMILDAIEKRDSITARLMIIQHIHNARDAWQKYLKKESDL